MSTKAVALPPVERLRERLEYNPDTGALTWKPKDGSSPRPTISELIPTK